jgi:hypothetical protein
MTSRLLGAFVVLILSTGVPARALAAPSGDRDHHEPRRGPPVHAVPELDPSVVGAIAAVVAGGALLIARRRKR